jgi:hypothetical protein
MTRRNMTPCKCLAGATSLGGPGHILPVHGLLLPMRIHPEIRDGKERSVTKYEEEMT